MKSAPFVKPRRVDGVAYRLRATVLLPRSTAQMDSNSSIPTEQSSGGPPTL